MRGIFAADNTAAGIMLNRWYNTFRILDGDAFCGDVRVTEHLVRGPMNEPERCVVTVPVVSGAVILTPAGRAVNYAAPGPGVPAAAVTDSLVLAGSGSDSPRHRGHRTVAGSGTRGTAPA